MIGTSIEAIQYLCQLATEDKQRQIREAAREGRLREMLTEEIAVSIASWDLCHDHYTLEQAETEARRRMFNDPVFVAKVTHLEAMMMEYIGVVTRMAAAVSDTAVGIKAGSKVRWINRPSLGIGTVVSVVPRKQWGGGYVSVRFNAPGYARQHFRLNHDEVELVNEDSATPQ